MISYTRPKNLRDILVRSQLPKQKVNKNLRKRVGFKKCDMTQCETCPYTKKHNYTHMQFHKRGVPNQGRAELLYRKYDIFINMFKGFWNIY